MAGLSPRPKGFNPDGQMTGTPHDFFSALDAEFRFAWDLAAHADNAKCARFITRIENSLIQPWHQLAPGEWLFLNPPFADIAPWAKKCSEEMQLGAKIALLVPASVDSNWFRDYVERFAERRYLNPRLKFVGHTQAYPKPMMVCLFAPGQVRTARQWEWKKSRKLVAC